MTAARNAAAPGRETEGSGSTDQAGRPLLMVADIPTLDELSARGWEIASAYLESGIVAGIAMGRQQMYDAWKSTAEVSAAVAAMIAGTPSYAELAQRRGQPDRAAAQRAILVRNGVAP